MHEFLPGTFAAVGSLDVPVIPVGLAYSPAVHYGKESFAKHMSKVASRRATSIAVEIGDPLPKGLDARNTADAARAEVEVLVARARATLDAHEA